MIESYGAHWQATFVGQISNISIKSDKLNDNLGIITNHIPLIEALTILEAKKLQLIESYGAHLQATLMVQISNKRVKNDKLNDNLGIITNHIPLIEATTIQEAKKLPLIGILR